MSETLIVTVYNRPQAMSNCLWSVSTCDLTGVEVLVSEDTRGGLVFVPHGFKHVKIAGRNSWDNIRHALTLAQDSDLIYFVEDDYVVEPGFISFCRAAYKQFQPLIVNADNAYASLSDEPKKVGVSHSHCMIHAGCISGEDARRLLAFEWTRHFEEIVQNDLIQHQRLSVFPLMPRAYDTGIAGVNLAARSHDVVLKNPPTPKQFEIGCDLRHLWQRDYDAQAKWGWE
jgi:hypothetical protein